MNNEIETESTAIKAAMVAAMIAIKETLGNYYTLENAFDVLVMLSVEHITQCEKTVKDRVTESVIVNEFIESIEWLTNARLEAMEIAKKHKNP